MFNVQSKIDMKPVKPVYSTTLTELKGYGNGRKLKRKTIE